MHLLGKKYAVLAPEGAEAAPAGGAPAPAPGVNGPASPAGDTTPFSRFLGTKPAGAGPQNGHDGGTDDELEAAVREDSEGRGIPHERVKQMRSSWEKRAREVALQEARQTLLSEFTPILEELGQLRELKSQFDPAAIKGGIAEAFLESLGVKKEKPAPKYITEEEFAKRFKEHETKLQREARNRRDLERAHLDMQAAKQKHGEWFEHFPWLEEVSAAVWAMPQTMEKNVPIGAIVDNFITLLTEGIGKRNAKYVEQKAREAGETPITPGSTPKPGVKPPAKLDHSPDATAKRAIEFLEKAGR